MFGNKKEKDGEGGVVTSSHLRSVSETPAPSTTSSSSSPPTNTGDVGPKNEPAAAPRAEEPNTDAKKRRGSSTAKAREIFTQAKNSLIHGDKDGPQTPLQKLSKTDAALGVPQGALNNSAGESQPTANSSFRVGVTEDKNKKCRRTMEDTHSYLYNFLGTPAPTLPDARPQNKQSFGEKSQRMIETDNGYFAVFDGHAGTFAAEWCGKKLHLILEDLMRKNPNTPVPELLDQSFTTADSQLEKLPLKNSGCTAICAVLRWEDRVPTSQSATGSQAIAPIAAAAAAKAEAELGGNGQDSNSGPPRSNSVVEAAVQALQEARQKATRQRVLYTANVGDARIVLCRNGKALRLSYDHKGMDENEGRRISKAGGLILNNRVNGVLAVTRALGDSYLKDLVTGHPYTTETVIQHDQDEFLILACDGLWDVCSDQEAVNLVREVKSPQDASKMLVDHALARFSTDNLSVMVVRFDSNKLQSNARMGIGVQGEQGKQSEGFSEAEMIVDEFRRNSIIPLDGTLTEEEEEKIREDIVKDIEQNQELGPETTAPAETNTDAPEEIKLNPPPPPVNETKS